MFFFFNDTATTEIYTLSLHDALPISSTSLVMLAAFSSGLGWMLYKWLGRKHAGQRTVLGGGETEGDRSEADRKSTRLNSSHANISYAVFCLKKKKDLSIVFAQLTQEI